MVNLFVTMPYSILLHLIKCYFIFSPLILSYLVFFSIYSTNSLYLLTSLFYNLGITSQSLKTVFEAIKSSHTFQSLLSINLSSNSMTIFPSELANLPALQKIILSGNMLGANTSGQLLTDSLHNYLISNFYNRNIHCFNIIIHLFIYLFIYLFIHLFIYIFNKIDVTIM